MHRRHWLALAIGTLTTIGSDAFAQQYTWTSPATGSWSQSASWLNSISPPAGGGSALSLQFISAGTSYTATNNLGASYGLNQLHLANTGAGTITIDGSSLNPLGTNPSILQDVTGPAVLATNLVLTSATTVAGTGTGQLILAGQLSGSGSLNKNGTGTLTISSNSPSYSGAVNINDGTLRVTGTLAASSADALGSGLVTVNAATLELADVVLGSSPDIGPNVLLRNGATLRATGTSSFYYPSLTGTVGAPKIANGSSSAPVSVTISAPAPTDSLTIITAVRNNNTNSSFATINVTGQGRITLGGGGLVHLSTFAGSWNLQSGTLQLGVAGGGEGEALNALGFKSGDATRGNTITVTDGTLAGATNTPIDPTATPDFYRASVVLAGGALASTAGVDARFGGSFSTQAGTTSYVDVFDPSSPTTPRNVSLVAGAAGPHNAPSTFSLAGTLIVTPGTLSAGGALNIARDGGTLSVSPDAALDVRPGATVNVSGLNVFASPTAGIAVTVGGRLNLAPDLTGTTRLSSLSLTFPSATLDLANNPLVLDYTGPSPADTLRQYLFAARNNGPWTGPGLTSSSAAADPQLRTAIAYAEASDLGLFAYAGQQVDSTTVVSKYTYYGDATLDGRVNADDYARLDHGYAKHLTGWINGDFNYDGTVDSQDYFLIDRIFAEQSGPLSPAFLSTRESQFGPDYVAALVASIPEPSLVGVVIFAIAATRRRKRR